MMGIDRMSDLRVGDLVVVGFRVVWCLGSGKDLGNRSTGGAMEMVTPRVGFRLVGV